MRRSGSGLSCLVLVLALAPAVARAHEHMWIASTADNGGALALEYDFARAFPTVPLPNGTTFVGADPAFNALVVDKPAASLYRLKDDANVSVEIVAIDPEVSIVFNGKTLRAPGDRVRIGTMPYLHQHPQWYLTPPPGAVGSWRFSFRIDSGTAPYKESQVYTAAVTNVVVTTTTTTTTTLAGPTTTSTVPDPGEGSTSTTTSSTTTTTVAPVAPTCDGQAPAVCDDGDPCTADDCIAGQCVHADVTGAAAVACRPVRLRGGGRVSEDCLVQFTGVSSTRARCTDGDPACDRDGLPDGACTFGLSVCVNMPATDCEPSSGLSRPLAVTAAGRDVDRDLATAIAALDPSQPGCTPPGVRVPLRVSLRGVRSGKAAFVFTARADARRDRDRITLTCLPSPAAPSLRASVQPVLSARCATAGCHQGAPPVSEPALEDGLSWPAIVGAPATNLPSMVLVQPGRIAESYLARKILGRGIRDRSQPMPLGCPDAPPPGGCLSAAETAAIVTWIARGAPND